MLQKLEGNFLRWQQSKSGKLQSIQIQTGTIVQSVQIDKDLRSLLLDLLTPNVSISLQVKVKKQKMIAKFVVLMPHCDLTVDRSTVPQPITVKVCTSKHCCKNGSKDICTALEQLQSDTNIAVAVKKVGCMGNCKNAPVVKIDDRKFDSFTCAKGDRLSPESAVAMVKKIWQNLRPKVPTSATKASSYV